MMRPDNPHLAPAPVAPRETSLSYSAPALREKIPEGMGGMLIFDPHHIHRAIGWRPVEARAERAAALLVTPTGDTLVAKPFYKEEAEETLAGKQVTFIGTRGPFNPTPNESVFADILTERHLPAQLGIEEHTLRIAEAKAFEALGITLVPMERQMGLSPNQSERNIQPESILPMHQARLERLRELMTKQGADGMIVTNQADIHYLVGGKKIDTEPDVETPDDVLVVQRNSSVVARIARTDTNLQRLSQTIDTSSYIFGIEENDMSVAEGTILKNAGVTTADVRADILRREKDDWEIEQLRKACEISDLAFTQFLGQLPTFANSSPTELDIKSLLDSNMQSHEGFDGFSFPTIVAFGPNGANGHHEASTTTIANGNFLVLDFGAMVHGYHADMTRTLFIGQPDKEARRRYATVLRSQTMALDVLKEGLEVSAAKVDQVANDYILSQGLPIGTGHSHAIGEVDHENYPMFVEGSTDTIIPRMVVTIEPGSYLHGENGYGIRIEDEVVKTEDGYYSLTHSSKGLHWIDIETGQQGTISVEDLLAEFPQEV